MVFLRVLLLVVILLSRVARDVSAGDPKLAVELDSRAWEAKRWKDCDRSTFGDKLSSSARSEFDLSPGGAR